MITNRANIVYEMFLSTGFLLLVATVVECVVNSLIQKSRGMSYKFVSHNWIQLRSSVTNYKT